MVLGVPLDRSPSTRLLSQPSILVRSRDDAGKEYTHGRECESKSTNRPGVTFNGVRVNPSCFEMNCECFKDDWVQKIP